MKFFTEADINKSAKLEKPREIADYFNRLLEERCFKYKMNFGENKSWHSTPGLEPSHEWKVLSIEPIEQDTAEKVLEDLATRDWTNKTSMSLVERARKLLAKEEK